MAMTNQQQTEAYQFFVIAFGAAPGVEYMTQISDAYNAGLTTQQIVNIYTTKAQFTSTYPTFFTSEQFAAALINNVVGSSASAAAKAEAQADIVGALNAGWSRGDVVYQIFTNLAAKDPADPMWGATSTLLANKVAVAKYVTEVQLNGSTDVSVLQGVLAGVTATSDVSTPAKIEAIIGGASGGNNSLTVGLDNIFGTTEGQTYKAPIVQNQNGAVTNTLESGDVIAAVGTGNKLVVDLALTTSGDIPVGPAISAATNNIQVVELRAQTGNTDSVGAPHDNNSHVDAENFNGVQQWWTVNSRSDIQIEDVRTRPEDTTIGMRNTDPEVGFRVYFDPEQLTNNARAEDSALTLKLDDITKPGDLTDVPVDAVSFKLDGVLYALKSDAIGASKTHPELVAALQAAIAAQPALSGLTVTLNANTTITIEDPAGKVFEKGAWGFIDGVVPADGNIVFQQTVGNPSLVDEPITTNVVLDNVGRTSAGGSLDIGSLGEGGVEQFNVAVDRSSWVESMESSSHLGRNVPGIQLQHLEIVNFTSTGAKGDLKVGERVESLDGRVVDGLTNVRVVNGKDFAGKLNLGITLTGDAVGRYLDGASAPVQFTYEGGAKDDIFNVDVDASVSNDPDFRLDVKMGAGNDRLIFGGADELKNISVDGGTGINTFVTSTSVGTDAKHEFKSFANFQNYEVEGTTPLTTHDFTTLGGVTSVVVATGNSAGGGYDTTLIDLAANNGIVLTGKNQTIGNASNADQEFDDIKVRGADGEKLTVTLQNTARIDGVLYVGNLVIDDENATNQSAVRTLDIVSAGARNTTNEIGYIDAERVSTFNLSGTQALTANIIQAANTGGAPANITNLVVNGSALGAKLDLGIESGIVTAVDAAGKTATFTGTAGATDRLTFDGAITATANTIVSGFETVRFVDGGGDFNASGVTGVTLYDIKSLGGDFNLNNLRSVETVQISTLDTDTVAGNELTFATEAATASSSLTLNFNVPATGALDTAFVAAPINLEGFTTVTLDLGGRAASAEAYTFDFVFQDATGKDVTTPPAVPATDFDFAKVAATNFVVKGGQSTAATAAGGTNDTVDLGNLSATLKMIDLSGYKGEVTAALDNPFVAGDSFSAPTATSGNTLVKVNGFELNFTDADHADATITTFQFTTDAVHASQDWTIDNFQGFNGGGSLSNLSILDLSALGVNGLVDIILTDVGGPGGGVHITSNEGKLFEIVLTGVAAADLSNENFKFAA